jgi:methylation protein EvaC
LKPRGVFMFEDPYLGDIVEKTAYDQIYDEHVFYFSLAAVENLAARHGLEVVDVEPQRVHGGEMRFVVAHRGALPVTPAVGELRARERAQGLAEAATMQRFRAAVEQSRSALLELLHRLRREGRRVMGYGATSKSTTVTNYCGLDASLVSAISDVTPTKIGRFSPGARIPVVAHAEFAANPPDYALLFAWNHAEEIRAKERRFEADGGRWIVYVPAVGVLP